MSVGIPDELFWELSAPEVMAVLERRQEDERREYQRVGVIVATILNVNRKPGTSPIRAEDIFRPATPQEPDTVESVQAELDAWAADVNASQKGVTP